MLILQPGIVLYTGYYWYVSVDRCIKMEIGIDRIILLVEDNSDDEDLTLRALKKNNILNKVFVVRDGAEALDYLFCRGKFSDRDIKQEPHLILLDLKLPKVDGIEVLRQLRADHRTRFLPIVILTTSGEQEDILHGYDLGANSYIQKPVDFEQFVEAIRHIGLYWLVYNVKPPFLTN